MLYSFGEKYYNLHLLVTLVVRHILLILRHYNEREAMNMGNECCYHCDLINSPLSYSAACGSWEE